MENRIVTLRSKTMYDSLWFIVAVSLVITALLFGIIGMVIALIRGWYNERK